MSFRPRSAHARRRTATRTIAVALAASLSVSLAACSESSDKGSSSSEDAVDVNVDNRAGDDIAEDGAEVVADPATAAVVSEAGASTDGQVTKSRTPTGVAASKKFFDKSDTVIVTSEDLAAQQQGAKQAVENQSPLLVSDGDSDNKSDIQHAIVEELERLEAKKVVAIGDPAKDGWSDDLEVEDVEVEKPDDKSDDKSEGSDKSEDQEDDKAEEDSKDSGVGADGVLKKREDAIKAAAELDSKQRISTPVFATVDSGLAATASARAAGAQVFVLPAADPRATKESSTLAQNLATIGLGAEFGSTDHYRAAAKLAGRGEQPGGGELVFPGRRMIAIYGHPGVGDLGIMGAEGPEQAVQHAKKLVKEYKELSDQPVIPAFEIIATVAASDPGPSGKYTNVTDPEELEPYVDAITKAGGYAVLDLQPGQATFLEQAKEYEDLLKRPHVGLALDPEWRFSDGGKPLDRVGSVEASEVNEVSDWLAKLVKDNDLPQKALVLHQFQLQMLRDREKINTDHPELALVLHADGHGTPKLKFETWDVIREDLDPRFFMAWKNFTKEDEPMFDPEETYNKVNPRPWFVSYQ